MANESNIEPDDIKSIPTFRAAYSDRTALLMAKLAYRAYDKFDKDDNGVAGRGQGAHWLLPGLSSNS